MLPPFAGKALLIVGDYLLRDSEVIATNQELEREGGMSGMFIALETRSYPPSMDSDLSAFL